MSIFGRTTAYNISRAERITVYRFLRDEPLWRLLTAIVKARFRKDVVA